MPERDKLKSYLFSLNKDALTQIVAADDMLRDGIREADNTFRRFIRLHDAEELALIVFETYNNYPEEELDEIVEGLMETVHQHPFTFKDYPDVDFTEVTKDFLYEYWDDLPKLLPNLEYLAHDRTDYDERTCFIGIVEFLKKISEN